MPCVLHVDLTRCAVRCVCCPVKIGRKPSRGWPVRSAEPGRHRRMSHASTDHVWRRTGLAYSGIDKGGRCGDTSTVNIAAALHLLTDPWTLTYRKCRLFISFSLLFFVPSLAGTATPAKALRSRPRSLGALTPSDTRPSPNHRNPGNPVSMRRIAGRSGLGPCYYTSPPESPPQTPTPTLPCDPTCRRSPAGESHVH